VSDALPLGWSGREVWAESVGRKLVLHIHEMLIGNMKC
jgi:hypothetical protein